MSRSSSANQKLPGPKFSVLVDTIIAKFCRALAWLNVVLAALILLQVVLRYAFGQGLVIFEELQWHLYAVCMLFGVSYAVVTGAHIRLDLLHRNFSLKTKERIEFFGILLFLMPMIIIVFIHSLDFVYDSWRVSERSDSPLGLPARWLIKGAIPASMIVLFLAALSRMVRAAVYAFKKE